MSKVYLARALAQQAHGGNPGTNADGYSDMNALASARKAYQDFLAMWKDADIDTSYSNKPRMSTPNFRASELLSVKNSS